MNRLEWKKLFLALVAVIGLSGSLWNLTRLVRHFYLWPLVRFTGYSALFASALLLLRGPRYNNRLLTEKERPE